MYICNCTGITQSDIVTLVDSSDYPFQFARLSSKLKSEGCCCRCLPELQEVIDEAQATKAERNSGSWIG